MAHVPQQVKIPWSQKADDFRHRALPLVVWSLSALVVTILLVSRVQQFKYIGMAQALQYEVSASANGMLETVVVDLYDRVEAGDVVAKLDDRPVRAAIQTSNATIRHLSAEFEAARSELLTEATRGSASWVADLRRFQIDEEQRRLSVLELRGTVASDEIELERLELEVRRVAPLLDVGLIGQMEYDNEALSRDGVARRLEDNKILLAQTEDEFATARSRRQEYERGLPGHAEQESRLLPLREAISVASLRLEEIELQRQALVLRSPVRGQVSEIFCRKGQSVVTGEPILMIAESSVTQIVAYLNEADRIDLGSSTAVVVASRLNPRAMAESVVLNVSPSIEVLPQRLWRDPRTPTYGRAVMIATTPGLELTPGELLDIKFLSQR